jgi:hypothetical protein
VNSLKNCRFLQGSAGREAGIAPFGFHQCSRMCGVGHKTPAAEDVRNSRNGSDRQGALRRTTQSRSSQSALFVATIVLMTHLNCKRINEDRGRRASQVANCLAESTADPMSPPLGAISRSFELDAIHHSGVPLDRRARLLEYDVPPQVCSWQWGSIARNCACASAKPLR